MVPAVVTPESVTATLTGAQHCRVIGNTVSGVGYRFTVLTPQLIRMEQCDDGVFVDAPTQVVVNRDFPVPDFSVEETERSLDIYTEHLHLTYHKGGFTPTGLSVSMLGRVQSSHRTTWRFGDPLEELTGRPANLGGTARTLDDVDGPTQLEPGLMSGNGFAVVDDSSSLVMTEQGWVAPRPVPGMDLYFFGYGRDYAACLRDWLHLAGPSPLLPRWTLGNWWSRYHAYSAEEYLALMDRFNAERLPFSVAVLDMDWHVVDVDPKHGSGWTGYTWNRKLFPDPAGFLRQLRERGLRVTLNVHPADGVRSYEDAYEGFALDLGLDPSSGRAIAFDIADREFSETYLRRLHHPHEDMGVDFWWLDWQSGAVSRVPGLDPLWLLNYVHFTDSARHGRRPLTFSRYAGLGSHRFPVGFSGDTVVSWASLAFQPYFTATAANVGYFWWSHDVGGHMFGAKDDELATRWVQFGAFSPINRLHSSSSPFNSKEPWRFSSEAERVMGDFLRLRNQLVPYLYTLNWLAHSDARPPLRPMYYDYPQSPEAYEAPNQYFLGPDLLVCPITQPASPLTRRAAARAWLPPGTWYDFFTGRRYTGGRPLTLHRSLAQMPVLARAGAVVALAADPMAHAAQNPDRLLVRAFAGADGSFTLLEDSGEGHLPARWRQETEFRQRFSSDGEAEIEVMPVRGTGVLRMRELTFELIGLGSVERIEAWAGELPVPVVVRPTTSNGPEGVTLSLGWVDLSGGVKMRLSGVQASKQDVTADVFELLDEAQIAYRDKEKVYGLAQALDGAALLSALHALDLAEDVRGALMEILGAN